MQLPSREPPTAPGLAPRWDAASCLPNSAGGGSIAKEDNQVGGLILKSSYANNRILDGLDDGFTVEIIG
ncbi:hypothetical protein [Streptomyces sp. NPDC003710]